VPVEEPSTASIADIAAFFDHLVERRQAVNAALPAPALNKKSSSPQAKVNG
jgi:hypothetical protein